MCCPGMTAGSCCGAAGRDARGNDAGTGVVEHADALGEHIGRERLAERIADRERGDLQPRCDGFEEGRERREGDIAGGEDLPGQVAAGLASAVAGGAHDVGGLADDLTDGGVVTLDGLAGTPDGGWWRK